MTNHAKDAAEKIGNLIVGVSEMLRVTFSKFAAEPIIQSAIDAATAPLREEIERLTAALISIAELDGKTLIRVDDPERLYSLGAANAFAEAAEIAARSLKGDPT